MNSKLSPGEKINLQIHYRFLKKYMVNYIGFFIQHQPEHLPAFLEVHPKLVATGNLDLKQVFYFFFHYYNAALRKMANKVGGSFTGDSVDTLVDRYFNLYVEFSRDTFIANQTDAEKHIADLRRICNPKNWENQ